MVTDVLSLKFNRKTKKFEITKWNATFIDTTLLWNILYYGINNEVCTSSPQQGSFNLVSKMERTNQGIKNLKCYFKFYLSLTHLCFLSFPCEACDCSHLGNNCDPKTGQCICPPNTIGERCSECVPNTWGHSIVTGCKVSGSLLSSEHFLIKFSFSPGL